MLVERLCRMREQGGTLALAAVGEDIVARLTELRVDTLFPMYDNVPAALDALIGTHVGAVAALAA